MSLTEEHANQIVDDPNKHIGEPIEWRCTHKEKQKFRFKVSVQVPAFLHLGQFSFVGQWNPWHWSFVFIGPSGEQIRKISTPHDGHPDPRRGIIAEPDHKHFWAGELLGDTTTYQPNDIRWDSADTALVDFLQECKITPMYDVPRLTIQTSLDAAQRP